MHLCIFPVTKALSVLSLTVLIIRFIRMLVQYRKITFFVRIHCYFQSYLGGVPCALSAFLQYNTVIITIIIQY
jgi:hypothetical protein